MRQHRRGTTQRRLLTLAAGSLCVSNCVPDCYINSLDMTKIRLIDFDVNEESNKKFLSMIKKLDRKPKKYLEVNGFENLEKFRSHFLSKAGNSHMWMIVGVGIKTEKALIDLFQKTFNKNHFYTAESKRYMKDFKKLSNQAKNALARKGIAQFETFYYAYFIKRQKVFLDDYPFEFVRKELNQFVKIRCDSIKSVRKSLKSNIRS